MFIHLGLEELAREAGDDRAKKQAFVARHETPDLLSDDADHQAAFAADVERRRAAVAAGVSTTTQDR